mgnify:CR=1 FL=1
MTYSVFDPTNRKDHTTATMFLDSSGGVTMQRYDVLKYRQFDKLTDKQLGFFWRPEEVDVMRDAKDLHGDITKLLLALEQSRQQQLNQNEPIEVVLSGGSFKSA